MSFDPTTASPLKQTSFSPDSATVYLVPKTQEGINLNTSTSTFPNTKDIPIPDAVIAGTTGIAQGAVDHFSDLGGLVKQVLSYVSPKLGEKLSEIGKNIEKEQKTRNDTSGLTKAQEESPISTAIGRGIGYTGGMLASGGLLSKAASSAVPTAVTKMLPATPEMAAQGMLGSAMAGEGHRVEGAAAGAVIPAVLQKGASSIGNFFTGEARQGLEIKRLQDMINKAPDEAKGMTIQKAVENEFKDFRATPGEVNTITAQGALTDYLSNNKDMLSPRQQTALKTSIQDFQSAKNLEDVHNARKSFSSILNKKFMKGDDALDGGMRRSILDVQQKLDSNLRHNANELGVLDRYEQANLMYKQEREADLINEAFDSTELPQGGNDWLNFNKAIIRFKKNGTYDKEFSPSTKEQIDGIKQTLKEANHILGIDVAQSKYGGNFIVGAIKTLALSPVMKPVLQYAGTPQGRYLAKEISKSLVNKYLQERIKATKPRS